MRFLSRVLSSGLTALLVLPVLGAPPQESDPPATGPLALQLKVEVNSAKTLGVQVTDESGAAVAEAAVAFRLPDGPPSGVFPDGSHSAVVYTDAAGKAQAPAITWSGTPGPMPIRITAAKGTAHAGLLIDQSSQPRAAAVKGAPAKPGVVVEPVIAEPATAEPAMARSGASSAETASKDTVVPPPGTTTEPPSVSITSASPASVSHSHKKWIVIAALSAAAGVGAMMALRGSGGGSASGAASGLTIGAPTISVGHP